MKKLNDCPSMSRKDKGIWDFVTGAALPACGQ